MIKAGAIELLDAVGREQVSIGNQASDDAVTADATDNRFQLGMEKRFASADRNDGGPQRGQPIDTTEKLRRRNGVRNLVELVAVGAGQIAAADRNQMNVDRMTSREHALGD